MMALATNKREAVVVVVMAAFIHPSGAREKVKDNPWHGC
jgi:hypothetical protein